MGRVSDRAQKRVQEENRGCQKGIPESISGIPSEFSVQGHGRRSTPAAAAIVPTAAAAAASANVLTAPTAPATFRPAAEQPSGESFATVAPAWTTGSPGEPPHADAGPGRSDAAAAQQLPTAVRLTVQIAPTDHDANATASSTSQSTTDASGPSSTSAATPPHADESDGSSRPATAANDGPAAAAADGNVAATAATTTNAAKPPYQCKHERNDEHGHDTTAITLHESTDVTQSATRTTAPSASWSSDAAAAATGWSHEPPPGCPSSVRQPSAAERHSPAMYPARMSEPGDRQFRLGG